MAQQERTLEVTAKPFPDGTVPFMYERFATAQDGEIKVSYSRGPNGVGLLCEVRYPDGVTRLEEHIDLSPMLVAWATQMINERRAAQE